MAPHCSAKHCAKPRNQPVDDRVAVCLQIRCRLGSRAGLSVKHGWTTPDLSNNSGIGSAFSKIQAFQSLHVQHTTTSLNYARIDVPASTPVPSRCVKAGVLASVAAAFLPPPLHTWLRTWQA